MTGKFTYGYLKEAVKAHLDLEEEELEAMNINQRFHIFANEAIQAIGYSKPKYVYYEFTAVASFTEIDDTPGDDLAAYWNNEHVYLVGQVIDMPDDFLAFATKRAYMWTDSFTNKLPATTKYLTYLSDSEFTVLAAANYLVPYQATWFTFAQDIEDTEFIAMPDDLALTIPIYVASVCLQQRDLKIAQAKRQEFELALRRCKTTNFLQNTAVTSTY